MFFVLPALVKYAAGFYRFWLGRGMERGWDKSELELTAPGHFSRLPAVNAGSTAVEREIPGLSCCALTRSKLSQEEMGAWPGRFLGRGTGLPGGWVTISQCSRGGVDGGRAVV